jgi:glutaredoxin-like YruB-family protein
MKIEKVTQMAERPKVTIYTTPTCPYCVMTKMFLKEHGVSFVEKNVAIDRAAADEMIKKSGQMGVPVLDIDGEIIVGFDRDAIKKALNLP